MSNVEALLDRLRTHIYLRNIMPEDWFGAFDRLRSGRIFSDEFQRCFSQMSIKINENEFKMLCDRYKQGDKVNYRDFCHEIEDIFTNRNLEKSPLETTRSSGKVVSRSLGNLESNEDPALDELISKLYHQVKVKGIHLRDAFMDFDKHNNGSITQSQFSRSNPFTDLSARELSLLYKRYSDPVLRDFSYRRLANDINQYGSSQPTGVVERSLSRVMLPHQEQSLKFKNYDTPHDQLIPKFAEHVRKERVRIIDFFSSHDTLKTGRIPVNKFTGTLSLFGFQFSQNDLDYLAEQYMINVNYTKYVKYKEFCTDVEEEAGMQVSPVKTRALDVPKEKNSRVERIIARIKAQVVRFRINILPTLQDFDRNGRGYISPIQFHRALTTLRISITNDERDAIAEEYGDDKGIDLFRFVEDVDPSHTQRRREFKPIGNTKESIISVYGTAANGDKFVTQDVADRMIYQSKKGLIPKLGASSTIDDLINDMHKWARINSVLFSEFLQTFDVHRLGEIRNEQFMTGIQISGYKLSEAEFDLIKEEYASPTREDYICWKRFDDDIKSITVPLDLEKTPIVEPQTSATMKQITTRAIRNVTPRVREILEEISKFIRRRRLCLVDQFRDFDPLNHKKVTATSFTRVLQLIGCYLSKERIDTLASFYNDPYTNFVDYGLFVADVDEMVGLLFGDRAKTSLVTSPFPSYSKDESEYLVSVRSIPSNLPSLQDVITKIQSFVFKRRVRLGEFFSAFDPLRKGLITKQKFNTVVGQAELPINADEIEILINKFGDKKQTDLFKYRKFLGKINAVYGPQELNRTPLVAPPVVNIPTEPSKTKQILTPTEENFIQIIIRRMREKVQSRRMNIRDQFTDYDRKPPKKFITRQQFRQSIARLGLSTDKYELDALCKKYKNTELDEVNYCAFCDDLEFN